ncbi:hypothetical protein [Pinibacter aurantiacus]|uniref:RNA polymerase alpha subunit C-terminal domain-containing protein n=1 Tax=Pinibacter aurantiacus TaxID=2851599 RepID=A0A9E2S874_9BACT|nr:hypothetical protein [Pinibacter aurantiacus]MBV4356304.1 hypothetical protein [Pinibacter aurantiacus]
MMPYSVEDISLEDLEKAGWISVKAIHVCKNNDINGLKDIISFYRKKGSFKYLRKCGTKIEKELSEICKNSGNQSVDGTIEEIKRRNEVKKLIKQLTKDEIHATNKHIEHLLLGLSVRARNGLQSLFAETPSAIELAEIIYSPTFNFRTVRNIGAKTIVELDNFTDALSHFIMNVRLRDCNNNIVENSQPTITDLDERLTSSVSINDFNPFKKAILNRHIKFLFSNLKVRARNGITQFLGEDFTSKELIDTIYSYYFDFQDIRNIGSKTVSELNNFKADITSFIGTLRFIEDDLLSREYTKLIIKTTFTNLPKNFYEQFETVFDNAGKIKLFKLIYFLIENGQIFNPKEREIFYFQYSDGAAKSIEQIGIEVDLTKERLRQLRIIIEYEVHDYFRFVLTFNPQYFVSYDISADAYFTVIDKNFIKKINVAEHVNFNIKFYSAILGLLMEKSHSVLGANIKNPEKGNYSNTISYKNCYLIEKTLFNSFNFETFTNDISSHLSSRITETYALHFEGYLLQFISPDGKKHFSSIKQICDTILYNEFDLVVSNEGYVIFERNVRKTLPEYTFEILEELGEMTKVEDILKAIREKYADLDINEQSIRSTLQREKNLFIYIGRTSTYGLKKWELEDKFVKGGTIRDIAEEYLAKYDKPQHAYDIVNYVKQFRDTSATNILSNIQAEDKNRFVFFEGGYIGLKNKYYAPSDTVFKRVAGTFFRIEILKKFNDWNYADVVAHYVNLYGYTPVQVISVLENRIQTGEIILNENNTITV